MGLGDSLGLGGDVGKWLNGGDNNVALWAGINPFLTAIGVGISNYMGAQKNQVDQAVTREEQSVQTAIDARKQEDQQYFNQQAALVQNNLYTQQRRLAASSATNNGTILTTPWGAPQGTPANSPWSAPVAGQKTLLGQ